MTLVDSANKCLKNLENIEVLSHQRAIAFKHFLGSLTVFLAEIEKYMERNDYKVYKNIIILCLSQIKKVLPMMQHVIKENEHHGTKEKIWYLCERLQWCISELRRVLGGNVEVKDVGDDIAGAFVHHIDYALQLLSIHQGPPLHCKWKSVIDDLLCQALTIAKISNEIDFKEISAISQKVLQGSNKLSAPSLESNKLDNTFLDKHLTESLAGDLVTLEQRVNTAVLKLVLQVFTDTNKPVRDLVSACSKREEGDRTTSSLEGFVSDLDIHSERIFHIGTFAMACSEDYTRIQGIRCCLASLESLDNYLVPALTAFYLDNQHPGKRAFIKFLTSHWQQEIATIQTLLDGIIDSTAFCQVCLDDISDKVEKLKKCYLNKTSLDGDLLKSVVKVGHKLYSHLKYNEQSIRIDDQLIQDISIALNECDTANQLHFSSSEHIDMKSVIKRCELLVTNIQKLSKHFSQIDNSPGSFNLSITNFPDSVNNLPLDISENSNTQLDFTNAAWIKKKYLSQMKKSKLAKHTEESCNDLEALKPYLSRVAERNNTFYVKTPCKNKNNVLPSADNLVNTGDLEREQTNGLDISDILDNLTSLSDTLSSIKITYKNISAKYTKEENTGQLLDSCVNQDNKCEMNKYKILSACLNSQISSALMKTGEISDVNTPDRLQDLKNVEAKIEMLKLGEV